MINQDKETESKVFDVGGKVNKEQIGSSGTKIFGGYFSEEYLQNLRGMRAADIWDKMRRSESQVVMLLAAIINPIKSANWEIEPYSQNPEHVKHAELIKTILFEGLDFDTFKHEALTFIPFGFSLFEAVHNVVFNHKRFGTFNGLASLGFRSQRTVLSWNLEKKTGRILSIDQQAYGDVADNEKIPGEFLIVFTNQKEGDNYEGISALRGMYGAYTRKQLYLKLTAIGVEKYAIGTPVGTVPTGKDLLKEEIAGFKNVLESYTSHETSYILKPAGWEIDIQKVDFDASKIVELLKFENTEMINSVVANFLALGTNGSGGAFALSNDLSDFFTSGIQSYADIICGGLNRNLIPNLCKLNFGELEGYPKIKVTGISDKAGTELANVVKTLIDAGALKADEPLEEFLRRQFKLPKKDIVRTEINNKVEPITLSEKKNEFVDKFDNASDTLKKYMQRNLKDMADFLKKKLINIYNGTGSELEQTRASTEVKVPELMLKNYEDGLKEELSKIAFDSLNQVKSENKLRKKLSEDVLTIMLEAPKGAGFYAALSPQVKAIVESRAKLLTSSQSADIEKIVTFQYSSSITGTSDLSSIEKDIDEVVNKTIEGDATRGMSVTAAAGDAVASVTNGVRMQYFFDPEVYSEIESFTFENNDPKSEICQELAGKTFSANDSRVDEFSPPLHHNCKSRLVANLKGTNNPEPSKDFEVSDSAKKSITL